MGSVRRRHDVVRVTLDRGEAGMITSLMGQVLSLLRADSDEPAPDSVEAMVANLDAPTNLPEGPILERLLPDAYRDDPDAAEEFRRLTDAELRLTKGRALQRVLDDIAAAGGLNNARSIKVDLDGDATESWLY